MCIWAIGLPVKTLSDFGTGHNRILYILDRLVRTDPVLCFQTMDMWCGLCSMGQKTAALRS